MEDLVCQLTDADTQHKTTTSATAEDVTSERQPTTRCLKKHTVRQTKGAAFSKRFIKRIIRKISTSDKGGRTTEVDPRRCDAETVCDTETTTPTPHETATEAEIREIFNKELSRCGDTTDDTRDTVEEWVQKLSRKVQRFGLPDAHGRVYKSNNARTRGVLRSILKEQTKKMMEKYRCTATKEFEARNTETDTNNFNPLYTPDELMQWKIIGKEVTRISNEAIDKVTEL